MRPLRVVAADRGGRMRGIGAGLAAGAAALLVLGGSSTAAVAAAPATAVVRGVVTTGGHPLAGIRVGTWSPARGRVVTGTTDAHGRFVLRSPAGVAVDVWAGASPDAPRAVFTSGSRHLVRGVLGAAAPAGTPAALWQRVTPAVPSRLSGGRALRLRLQQAGRFLSSVPQGASGRIALDRGGLISHWVKATDGTVDSGWLVPGRYAVRWDPRTGRLPVTSPVDVVPGTTRATPPAMPVSTTLSIHVTSGGKPVGAGVPVVRLVEAGELPSGTTDADGTVVLRGIDPGTRTYVVGRYRSPSDEDPAGPPTDDGHLPAEPVSVSFAAGQATASVTVDVQPAARITGSVAVRDGHPVRVLAEDAEGNPVRSAFADDGTFSLGGLPAGTYRVLAEDVDAAVFTAVDATVAAGATAAVPGVLRPSTPDPVVSGRIAGGGIGSVRLRSPIDPRIFIRDAEHGRSGRFRMTVVPGRFLPIVFGSDRWQSSQPAVTLTGSTTLHLAPAPPTAALRAQPQVRGIAVPVPLLLQGPRIAVEEFLEGPQYSDRYSTEADGRAIAETGLPAGRYRVVGVDGPLPATDGPWSYRAESKAFRLTAGATTHVGAVRITVQG